MGINLEVPLDELRKKKLFIATPMYGAKCDGMFARSMMELVAKCGMYGIPMQPYFLFNESLITRARNYCCDEFMRSDCTHMFFVDSDIGFNADDAIALLALQSDQSPYDIIGAVYPKKTIAWEKIVVAVEKGFAAEDPNVLEKFVGDYVFNPKSGRNQIPLGEPVEVLEIGTGFMMIRKNTFKKFDEAFPELLYKPDHVRTEHFDGKRKIMQYFQAAIDPKSERYLSEDYWFCQKIQEIGLTTWICPWMKLQHAGAYVFGSSGGLIDLAQLGVTATADSNVLDKIKDKNKAKAVEGLKRGPKALPKPVKTKRNV